MSFLAEGVFQKFPDSQAGADGIRFHLAAGAVCGGPTSFWRGVRTEVPWVDRAPADIVRDHVRFTLQPADVPLTPTRSIASWITSAPTR